MFTEQNTIQDLVRVTLSDPKLGWDYIPREALPRMEHEILVEEHLEKALRELNPELKKDPSRVEEVIYKLGEIIHTSTSSGLIKANEEFAKWIKNEITMPYGPNGQHIPIKIIDYEKLENNGFVITTEYSVKSEVTKRADIVLLVNGIPLVVIETKTPVRPSETWADGALQITDDYEKNIKELFVPNVFSAATEGKELWYGAIGNPPMDLWEKWKSHDPKESGLRAIGSVIESLFSKKTVLEMLQYYTVFATDGSGKKIKLIARYPQYEAVNLLVDRVVEGKVKKGLIWHFQGSGKSLLMIFAAMRLRNHPALNNPTVLIVVDRIDLDIQIAGKFNATNVPNTIGTDSREELQRLLSQDTRKVIITTIHKFAEADTVLNNRSNIIVLVDEADRTQEGELGRKMRNALPNAFMFGLTGTPINKKDRNTFLWFGADEDENRYLHRYSFEESVKDHTTLPIVFEPRLTEFRIDRKAIDEGLSKITTGLSDADQEILSQRLGTISTLIKSKKTIEEKAKDIVKHFKDEIEPKGFKAQIVAYDRDCCRYYKEVLDKLLPEDTSEVVMTVDKDDSEEIKKKFTQSREDIAEIQKRFNNPNDPLKFLIVTQKLLRGFDAPILQVMYLDKLLKDQGLLQAICRVNRPAPGKEEGIIVDYIGVFDDVSKAITYDAENIAKVVTNIKKFVDELPQILEKCLKYFEVIDRSKPGYEGLIEAQDCLNTPELQDGFANDFYILTKYWDLVSKFATEQMAKDYKWLTSVYESIQPPSGRGVLVWRTLGPKATEMVHQHVEVSEIKDDIDSIVLDDELIEAIIAGRVHRNPREIEINLIRRLRRHVGDPRFTKLGERLERARERYRKKLITSIEFLKELLGIAKDVVATERQTKVKIITDNKQALTAIFEQCRIVNPQVKQIVTEIDEIVTKVKFDGWADTHVGRREIQQAIYRILFRNKLHNEKELFDKIYDYIKEHY